MGGGSAQDGDDVTAQPLKDELFLPALKLPCSSWERRGHRAALPDTAGQGSDRPGCTRSSLRTRWVPARLRSSRAFAGRTGSPGPEGREQVGVAGAEFGKAPFLPHPVPTSDKKGF